MDTYDELIDRIYSVPEGPEQIAYMEELVRLADSNNDISTAYRARREIARVANEEGFPEKAIVAFSWCLAKFDEDEELDHWHSLLWQYKVILEMIPVFHTVSREQIVNMQEDMAKRCARFGETERTAHYYRAWNHMRMGDYEKALDFQKNYIAMPRTAMSDCLACERDRQVELLSRMKMDDEALNSAAPILSGEMSCGEVPEFTNAHVTRTYLRTGDLNAAKKLHKKAYKRVTGERKYLGTIGDLMLTPVRDRNFRQGVNMFTKHFPAALDTASTELRFRFLSASALLMESLAAVKPKPRKMRLPTYFEGHRKDDQYDPAELANWLQQQAEMMAGQFNQRNQNRTYDDILAENRELAGL